MKTPRIRLVTRGDDAGSCCTANLAIRDCCVRGILRNTSVLAPAPAVAHAAAVLRECDGLCIGLHACITAEWDTVKWGPVLPARAVPSLVDKRGHFRATPEQIKQHGFDPDEVMAELAAQLALLRALKFKVEYMDCHMCFNWLPGLEPRLAAFAAKEGLVYEPEGLVILPRIDGQFDSPVAAFCAALAAARPGTYLCVTHPGYVRADLQRFRHTGYDNAARDRDWQRRMLMDPAVIDCCARHGIHPVRYVDLPARRRTFLARETAR